MNPLYKNGLLQTLGGFCVLIIVMGIGRFAYTALLPYMMHSYQLNEKAVGTIAAWNYTGYLLGVLAMFKEKAGLRRYLFLSFFLCLSFLTTLAMGLAEQVYLWNIIRFIAGIASGACFVLCSAIVLDTLATINKPILAGILYSGVGVGIALSGLSSQPLVHSIGVNGAWIATALLCIPLMLVALTYLRPAKNFSLNFNNSSTTTVPQKVQSGYYLLLFIYFLEGFGYIIGTTFLVSLVKTTTQSATLASTAWIITGIAAALSAPLWRYAAKKGYQPMLILAFLLQAIGVVLPIITHSPAIILLGALLLGGTFMGITVLALQYGIALSGKPSAYTIALLTGVYGIGQIIGPFITGLISHNQGFELAFILSAISLFIAAILLIFKYIRSIYIQLSKEKQHAIR
ncbi:YbfB/YjiJ family MFS transporter [Entomomonas asaccharolytica]|uniref:YbfB/YjiJ family MFS transporter n=1 Tax=Entomomonas asaccharolytica TaxID=2785331 RepID=A0A974NHP6_9GAMM|nr:YbfB/YjiJ family MFS transporter [Entomomonas asaccharolytica]QQP86742.1 YbfB/YjiJ family MFS transporter [Entomomonas asaccharolytica]